MVIRRRTWLASALLLGGASVVALIAWQYREPIARDLIDGELATRQVPAGYDIETLGTQRQRLVNVRLGDPANPDLTADWVEIDTGLSLSGVAIRAVRAGGVRLKARFDDKGLSMGSVDRLLPPPSKEPFRLPVYDVALADAQLALSTPWGLANIALEGSGRLDDGFRGKISAAMENAGRDDCRAQRVSAGGTLRVSGGKPEFDGPVDLAGVSCSGVALKSGRIALKTQGSSDFARWQGDAGLSGNLLALAGQGLAAQRLSGAIRFEPEGAGLKLRQNLVLDRVSTPAGAMARLVADGSGTVASLTTPDVRLSGTLAGAGFVPKPIDDERFECAGRGRGRFSGSALVQALRRAATGLERGSGFDLVYAIQHANGRGEARLGAINAQSASGARLAITGNMPMRFSWPGGLSVQGDATLAGGGFPTIRARLAPVRSGLAGRATMADWRAGDARLALAPVRSAGLVAGSHSIRGPGWMARWAAGGSRT